MLNADMIYEAADYLRLSKEDGDFSLSNDKLESDSISSQRAIIERFVAQNPNIKLVAEFCDDGYTGTNFDRPDFQRMMEAVKAGKINCVIVKDLSRFGRDYIDAGKYIEKIFPQLGVRFIAVNDNYDSLNHSTGDSLVLPVKNFLNDSYSRDISIKVRMIKLSPKQTRYVSIDSVNHVIEAATAVTANPLSILLAGETIRLVAEYLPKALANPEDLKARYCLSYASMIAGTAFDNGLLHFTHALEHPLSGIKPELAHGLGLSMILPAIIEECYPACSATLGTILRPLTPDLKGTPDEAHKAARGVETWPADMGVPQKLEDEGFTENDIPRLCELTRTTPSLGLLLSVAPVPATPERIEKIYRRSLKKMDA